jgi:NADPH-dependent 2,4-dienoyl-CoA reductase/sulfur reductase-like enzyme/nitrite reductase/ring-hydroxylating ferredoxin subunit
VPDNQWKRVVKESALKEGVPISLETDDGKILLVRIGKRIHACGAMCTHYGGPLAEGFLLGSTVTCPWHNASFDLETGRMLRPPALEAVPCYPVKVEDGQVYVGEAKEPRAPRPRGSKKDTFVIIGAGAAGNAAAETLRREGFPGRVILITAESDIPYDRPSLSKTFLEGDVDPADLALRSEDFYKERGIRLLTGRRVTSLDVARCRVLLAQGKPIAFDKALLATGGIPRRPEIQGTELKGFHLLRSLGDARAIVAGLKKAKRVVIMGAGFIAMEAAASLRRRGLQVHVVAHGNVPMAKVFGDRVGTWLRGLHAKQGVRFHLGKTVTEVRGNRRVEAVVLSDGGRIVTDVVLAGLGIVPAVEYLKDSGLVVDGAVPVNGRLQTGCPRIFAAGDIAVVSDRRTGDKRRVEHWVVAERMGQHAARAMLGSRKPYEEPPFFWTRQFDVSVQYVGFASRFDRIAYRGVVEEGDFLAGYYQGGILKAAAGVRRPAEIAALGRLIEKGVEIPFERFKQETVDLPGMARRELGG